MNCLAPQITTDSVPGDFGFRFQPIVKLADSAVAGYELLAGRERCPNNSPEQWRGWYDRIPFILEQHTPPGWNLIFVNIDGDQLEGDLSVLSALARARQIVEGLLVIECTERGWLESSCTSIQALKTLGFRIAVDDVGEGEDGLGRVSALRPEFAKISHTLFHSLRNAGTQTLSHLRQLLEQLGCVVILEGIETPEDRALATAAGFKFGQGWLFPATSWPPR
ncbi:MAG: EAL domain-containing protein [Burkholderiales bacterium]|nr:EAL domain-containing protein [Burkholderiales bacterium]